MSEKKRPNDGTRANRVESGSVLKSLKSVVEQAIPAAFADLFILADEALFERADAARNMNEQRSFFDAMRTLRNQRNTVTTRTLDTYLNTFNALLDNDLSLLTAHRRVGDDGFELLENHVLEEMIALDTIVSLMVSASGSELQFFNKRLEYLLGRPIRDEENPFVPEALCEAFADQLRRLHLDMEPRLLILKHFEKYFVVLWPKLVGQCNELLKGCGIRPDLEQEKRQVNKSRDNSVPGNGLREQAPRQQTPREDAHAMPAQRQPQPQVPQGAQRTGGGRPYRDGQLLADIHRRLNGALPPAVAQSAATTSAPSACELAEPVATADALTALASHLCDSGLPPDTLDELSLRGLESVIADLLTRCGQQLDGVSPIDRSVIRVLDQSFKKITAQKLIPEELSSLVLRLEIPVAGMVLNDPQFLDRVNHPGRRLINEMFKVSVTYLDGTDGNNDPLRKAVNELVAKLGKLNLSNRELTRLLAEFIDFVEKDKRQLAIRERRLLEEEEAAAKVAVTHQFVYEQLAPLLIGKEVPSFFRQFCEDAWSKVIFLNVLREGVEEGRWQVLVAQLVEVVAVISGEKAVTSAEIDALLRGVEGELEHISLDPAALNRWLTLLSGYLREVIMAAKAPLHNPAFAIVEIKELVLRLPGVAAVEPPPMAEDMDIRALEAVDALKQGVWVEFQATANSAPVRSKLAGIILPTAKYVFTNRKGVKVAEESRSQLAAKLKSGSVIVIDNANLFDEAFSQVISDIQGQGAAKREQGFMQ